ncbi:MAG: zf-TFIIB domain-containing protein [Myxococcales bacterium]|nr:zf-TFIIB domain-containing protein [Myxococcales bacterium]
MRGQAPTERAAACSACAGVWLDDTAATRLRDNLGPELIAFSARAGAYARVQADTSGFAGGCPWCGAPLARYRDHEAGVELDACRGHGTWFDRGEVERVAEAVARAAAARPQVMMQPQGHYEAPVPHDYVPPAVRMSATTKMWYIVGGAVGFLVSIALVVLYVILRVMH